MEKVLEAYERALTIDDESESTGVTVVQAPTEAPGAPVQERRLPRPDFWPGMAIDDYPRSTLIAIARWIESDDVLRTEDEVLTEMMDTLGFRRRGSRIVNALTDAIRTGRDRNR